MDHVRYSLERRLQRGRVGDRAGANCKVRQVWFEEAFIRRRPQEHGRIDLPRPQCVQNMTADEARSAGEQDFQRDIR